MRIQNEIISDRFNRFADIIDLDRLAKQEYRPEIIAEMSEKLANTLRYYDSGAKSIGIGEASRLLEKSQFGKIALPRQVNAATTGGLEEIV